MEDHDVSYKSSVQAVDENSFAIAIPYHKGEPLILRSGDTIIVKLFTAKERFIFSSSYKRKQDQYLCMCLLTLRKYIACKFVNM